MSKSGFRIEVSTIGTPDPCIRVEAKFDDDDLNGFWVGDIPWRRYVRQPNWIERRLGVTLSDKTDRAKRRVAKAAERRVVMIREMYAAVADALESGR